MDKINEYAKNICERLQRDGVISEELKKEIMELKEVKILLIILARKGLI